MSGESGQARSAETCHHCGHPVAAHDATGCDVPQTTIWGEVRCGCQAQAAS